MFHRTFRPLPVIGLLATTALLGGCSTSDTGQADGFQLELISVPEGEQSWQINREISFRFNADVDFSSINLNSIQIRQVGGAPAVGSFTRGASDRIVLFQPTCPTEPSPFADAGFLPGGVQYEIRVVGADTGGGISIRDTAGRTLTTGQVRRFRTPDSFDVTQIFEDDEQGPPQPVVLDLVTLRNDFAAAVAAGTAVATSLDLQDPCFQPAELDAIAAFRAGGAEPFDPALYSRITFGTTTCFLGADPDDTEVLNIPLNLYSRPESKISVFVVIDQAVDPSATNISPDRIGVEFFDEAQEQWRPVTATVGLLQNCGEPSAVVQIDPVGILPPTTRLRACLTSEFRDIRGNFNLLPFAFGRFDTQSISGTTSDEVKEDFLFGQADDFTSLEDVESATAVQRAEWGDGTLQAAFGFAGTGGPSGEFDFELPLGQTLQFSTASQTISSFDLSQQQLVTGGVIQVRDFTLKEDSLFRATGPNPLVIFATGNVCIEGVLDVSGFAANNVQSLNLAQVPQAGGVGAAGGGTGGIGSPLTSSSTPRGGPGSGAFEVAGLGGVGGETGYKSGDRNWRRPGGGGAGVFGPDEDPTNMGPDQAKPETGLIAQPGFDGFDASLPGFQAFVPIPEGSFGAETNLVPALGGSVGPSPFLDSNTANNFFGVKLVDGGAPIIGELNRLWAGSGGGGGGDAINGDSFPSPQFQNPTNGLTPSDFKGGGGGGGAGGVHIIALGSIKFGVKGQIISNGGRGGTGESTFFIDRVGGGGGGGSGGHVVLESNTNVDLSAADGSLQVIQALGARGGLGLPLGENPEGTGEFIEIFNVMQRRINEGGSGGPGIVQIHVPGGTEVDQGMNVLTPGLVTVGMLTSPDALILVPSFGSQSRAQSDWIALGAASPASGATATNPVFLFDGTDGLSPDEGDLMDPDDDLNASNIGFIQTSGSKVTELDPVYVGSLAAVDADSVRINVAGVGSNPGQIANAVYRSNPNLLIDFLVVLERNGVERRFNVDAATGNSTSLTLTLSGNALTDFTAGDAVEVIPRFFRVITTVEEPQFQQNIDTLLSGQSVQVQFQAAALGTDGGPDTETILVDWTGNIEDLNAGDLALPPAFFRFAVVFDTGVISSATPRPSLEFLRMPFEFSGQQ